MLPLHSLKASSTRFFQTLNLDSSIPTLGQCSQSAARRPLAEETARELVRNDDPYCDLIN